MNIGVQHLRRSSSWILGYRPLLVVILACYLSFNRSEAFQPKNYRPSILWGRNRSNKMATAASLSVETPPTKMADNWRVVPAGVDDYSSYLVDRAAWSESQFMDSLELYDHFMACEDSYVSPGIKEALNTLDHAYRLYGPESVICSFNGGKDAVVILHLVRAAHAKYYNSTSTTNMIRPRVIYFDHDDEFPEVIEFLHKTVQDFDLDMLAFEKGVKFANGLKIFVDNNVLPGCGSTDSSTSRIFPMAFVLGTRSTDPNAEGQDHFTPSSHWMPPFMRVNPVLHWNYGTIWHFLRLFQLPYCSLYDQGYTSLGTTKNTLPCPALRVLAGEPEADDKQASFPKFWPAYMLRDWDQERAGRIKKEKASEKQKNTTKSPTSIPRTVSAMSTVSDLRKSEPPTGVLPDNTTLSENGSTKVVSGDDSIFTCDSEFDGQKSVGILIIGDEILKGMTVDVNTNAAAKALRKECVKLARVVVVSDDPDEIVKDIQRLQSEVDVIITSGGVGPTHDDVTIKSVAASLQRDMVFHEEMADLLQSKMKTESSSLSPAQIKMATLPSNSKLRYLSTDEDDWPVLQCRNIFILPGVPEFFAKKIENVAAYLSSQLERGAAYKVVLSVDEASIVDALNDAVKRHPNVTFGSYPFVSHPEYKTVLTLEGTLTAEEPTGNAATDNAGQGNGRSRNNSRLFDANTLLIPKEVRDRSVRLALDDLLNNLPDGSILRVENDELTPFS